MQSHISQQPTYDPDAVQPMRDELTTVGFEELLSPEDIDRVLNNDDNRTVLVMINSVLEHYPEYETAGYNPGFSISPSVLSR